MSGRISRIFFLSLFSLLGAATTFAAVARLSFTTDPQTLAPGTISGTLTVQLQDAVGASSPATETMDVEFTSTSPTGEFLSPSSESAVTKTISSGSANKNFRYRDSATGLFTLTVKAKGRTSGTTYIATQPITISSQSATSSEGTASSTPDTAPPATVVAASNPTITYVYYSSVPLSPPPVEETPALSAGYNRMGTVGSPLEFRVHTNVSYRKNIGYNWNFGDGSTGAGEVVAHTYEYPGNYVVMLNASSPQGPTLARAEIEIAPADFSITYADPDRVEITNASASEASLYGRALVVSNQTFIFPQDTIVGAHQSLSFAHTVTSLTPETVGDVILLEYGEAEQAQISKVLEEKKKEKVAELTEKLSLLQRDLASRASGGKPSRVSTPPPLVIATTTNQNDSVPVFETQTGAVNQASWWGTLKKFLMGSRQ